MQCIFIHEELHVVYWQNDEITFELTATNHTRVDKIEKEKMYTKKP